jgi:hypothetical protein
VANRLRKVKVDEVSLVPRPANQFSYAVLHKNDPTPSDVHVPVPMGDKRKKKRPGAKGDIDMPQIDKSALDPEVAEYVTKLEDAVIDLTDRVEKHDDTESTSENPVEDLLKSADPALVEYVQGIQKEAEEAKTIAKAEQDQRIDREFLAKAESLTNLGEAREVADVLKSAAANLPEADFAALEGMLASANGKIESGSLFAELGKAHQVSGSGSDKIEKAAEALRAENPSLTKEQAVDLAVQKNPALYNDYLTQEG